MHKKLESARIKLLQSWTYFSCVKWSRRTAGVSFSLLSTQKAAKLLSLSSYLWRLLKSAHQKYLLLLSYSHRRQAVCMSVTLSQGCLCISATAGGPVSSYVCTELVLCNVCVQLIRDKPTVTGSNSSPTHPSEHAAARRVRVASVRFICDSVITFKSSPPLPTAPERDRLRRKLAK